MIRYRCKAAAVAMAALLGSGPAEAYDRLADAQARLGVALAAALSAEDGAKGRSVVISPFSLASALSLVQTGFADDVKSVFDEALGFEGGGLEGFMRLSDEYGTVREIALAARVWFDDGARPSDAVASLLETRLKAPIGVLDLSSPQALETINAWAEKETRGAIGKAIERLPDDLAIVAASALSFKGEWVERFDPAATRNAPFTPAIGEAREVAFMTRESDAILYREGDGFKAVDLPYAGDRFSLVALLPQGEPAKALQNALGKEKPDEIDSLLGWLRGDGFNAKGGTIELPRFTLSSSYDMLPALMRDLTEGRSRKNRLSAASLSLARMAPAELAQLQQVATMTVNEEGTVAAAVTTAMGVRSIQKADRFHLRFDRPFLAALRDRRNGMILFLALVQDVADGKTASR